MSGWETFNLYFGIFCILWALYAREKKSDINWGVGLVIGILCLMIASGIWEKT